MGDKCSKEKEEEEETIQMERLMAAVTTFASVSQDQSKDNRIRLDRDTLKKSLVKNLTDEQKLLMRVVLGGDCMKQPLQSLVEFKLPKNASELLGNSNLKLFKNKLRLITEDFPCQPNKIKKEKEKECRIFNV